MLPKSRLTDLGIVLSCKNPLDGDQIDFLEVAGWDKHGWTIGHTNGLIHLCAARKVKHLYFVSGGFLIIIDGVVLPDLVIQPDLPFLHDLENISFVASEHRHRDLGPIFEQSNAKEISLHPRIQTMEYIIWFQVSLVDSKALDNNYSILKIDYIDEGGPVDFVNAIPKVKHLEDIFERNQNCRKRCQMAAIIFIGKVFLSKDICRIVAKMIWGTRGTKLWKPKE
jgi:hypothetical protein